MRSKSSHEGYLLVDHRAFNGTMQEMATLTCSHCNVVMVKNPQRVRERAYCPKCDHYLCDACGAARAADGGQCKRVAHEAEKAIEAAFLEKQRNQHGLVSHNGILLTK